MSRRSGKPPKHGVISVTTMPVKHAKQHLAAMTASAGTVADYGGHDASGFDSRGSFEQGGASSGADYQTTSADSVGDSDSQGASGY